ncbi:MAG: S8 family serine peptidase [Candidatus Eisenbacteria bacterium]|nr:S8 family serine peptidase [Candidatus Eisenbacteria bacterium]
MHRSGDIRGRWVIGMLAVFLCIAGGSAAAEWGGAWQDKMFDKEWRLTPREDQILVQYEASAGEAVRASLAAAHGLEVLHAFDPPARVAVYTVLGDAAAAAAALLEEPAVAGAAPAVVDQEGFTKYYIPTRVTVQFQKHLSHEECLGQIARAGSQVVVDYWTPGYYTVSLPAGWDVFEAVRYWQEHPQTLFAEPSYMCYDDALYTPNDPLYPDQWPLKNTGNYGGGFVGADVEAEPAWDLHKGHPEVIISVIDTGMDTGHEDLAGNLLPRNGEDWDFSGGGTAPTDYNGHGTSCSGIAAAVQDNATGVTGVAPECRLMPLKVDLASGHNENRADAINYATSRRPEFLGLVISCSWRMSSGDFTAVEAACQNAWANDVVLCFASGNDNGAVNYPAKYPSTIAVGASSPCDERKSPSSCDGEYWWGSNYGPELDVVAPGVLIYTTDISGGGGYTSGEYVSYFNGTSSACPLAAGICGLIWSANPALTNAEVRQILRDSAEDQVGPAGEDTPGFDIYFGYGRVNAYQALLLSAPTGFEDDMESGEGQWTHAVVYPHLGYGDDWHLSQARNHTPGGQYSWKCGDEAGGDYSSEISAALVTPQIVVQPGAALEFWHWMDVAQVDESTAGDAGVIELSIDGGESWQPLVPAGGYTHTWSGGSLIPFHAGQPVWSGSFDWRRETVFLEELSGAVQFRFRFGTRGEAPTGEGWYVDDVELLLETAGAEEIEETASSVRWLNARPNPAGGRTALRFRLDESAPVRITLHDVAGRRLRTWDLGTRSAGVHSVVFDGRDAGQRPLPAGVYLYRLASGADRRTGRLVWIR